MSFCLDTRGTVLLSMRASSVSSKYENCRFIGYAASVSLSDANYIRAQSHRETTTTLTTTMLPGQVKHGTIWYTKATGCNVAKVMYKLIVVCRGCYIYSNIWLHYNIVDKSEGDSCSLGVNTMSTSKLLFSYDESCNLVCEKYLSFDTICFL